jgi:hypothetical protein
MLNWKCAFFGYPDWVPSTTPWGLEWDYAFTLTTKPDHDVGVTEIKHPDSGDTPGCPCIPVEVTVENFGKNDEFGVDVNIEIRHYQWCDDFEHEGPWYFESSGPDCNWQPVMGETAFPFVVSPHSGNWMMELDQVGCPGGYSILQTMEPDDFSCKCNPQFSFWMWHDEYGSDDHINIWIDAGDGWTMVGGPFYRLTCEPGCPPGWQEHVIDLSAYAHDPDPIFFTIEGICDMPLDAYNLHIDDVCVYDLEYAECTEIDIPSGEVMQVEFPCWTPCKWQKIKNEYWDFEVTACTKLDETCVDPKDQVPDNNCLTKWVTIYFPCFKDVAGWNITSPVCEGPHKAQTMELCGTIKNLGQFDACCFPVTMRVFEMIPGAPAATLFFDDFSSGPLYVPPPQGWTEYGLASGDWYVENYNCGSPSGAPSAVMYYRFGAVGNYGMHSGMIDTTGQTQVRIDFYYSISVYAPTFSLQIQTSNDATSWNTVYSTNPMGSSWGNHVSFVTSVNVGGPFYIGVNYFGDPYDMNWWNVDDVEVYGLGSPDIIGNMVFEEEVCIEELPVCTELEICFGEWTPVPPDPCFCGIVPYLICIETDMCTDDQTPENDEFCKIVYIEFNHDVGIEEFTAPCPPGGLGGDIIFDQQPTGYTAVTSDVDECFEYIVYDDFFLDVDPHEIPGYIKIGDIHWWGLGLNWVVDPCDGPQGWEPMADPCELVFDIIFYEDDAGVPGAPIAEYLGVSPTCTDTGDTFAGWPIMYWEYDLDPVIKLTTSGWKWVSIQSTAAPGSFLWHNSYDGNSYSIQEDRETDPPTQTIHNYDQAFQLTAPDEIGYDIDCYIMCGEHDICVMLKNYGTYLETVDVYHELYIWNTETETLDLVQEGVLEDVEIEPCGTEKEVCIKTYEFDPCGYYFIWVWVDLGLEYHEDCFPCNNYKGLGVAVDCCPPESCHDLNPVEPDGENNWYTSPVQVHLYGQEPCTCCTIHSGVKEIVYILNGVQNSVPGGDGVFTISEDGVHHVEYYAVDNVGHEEVIHHSFEVAIDTTDPTVELIYDVFDDGGTTKVEFTALASDETSGMNRVEFFIGTDHQLTVDSPGPYKFEVTWSSDYKTKTFYAYAYDNAGNADSDDVYGGDIPTSKTKDTQSTAKTTSRPANLNRVSIRGI